jgi:hypothetical protein
MRLKAHGGVIDDGGKKKKQKDRGQNKTLSPVKEELSPNLSARNKSVVSSSNGTPRSSRKLQTKKDKNGFQITQMKNKNSMNKDLLEVENPAPPEKVAMDWFAAYLMNTEFDEQRAQAI